ncbi:FxsA family protein [Solimonas sp. SE-A11]|uniref:FxsA family protein n=1 Tax=Solimonas sp. SE-A11 TaxID=3054954 RepID=UPI00259D08BC|nr:FxsA family protein [Solimonas sp. SE-A11]MDM4771215.1 FxsA family protein [Solimonas sp. SE-A11]
MPLLLLLAWTFLETLLLMRLGRSLGGGVLLLYLLGSAAAGVLVMRRHGLGALQQVRSAMSRGEMPAAAMMEGLLGLAAGMLLILPGLLSDAMALLLLVLRRRVARQIDRRMAAARPDLRRPVVIEGEYRETTRPPTALPPEN